MKKTLDILEDIRIWNYEKTYGLNGAFIKLPDCGTCTVCWGENEDGWEHVSIAPRKKLEMPTWNDMATLKDIFFNPEEECYQIMPKHSEYVNLKDNCLHLWRPANGKELGDLLKNTIVKECNEL